MSTFALICALLSVVAPLAAEGGADPHPVVGMNVLLPTDWDTSLPYIDLFKTSRPWISGAVQPHQWNDGRALALDRDGWVRSLLPGQVARTIMLIDRTTEMVGSGRWVVTWDGSGQLEYESHGVSVLQDDPGRQVIKVNAGGGGIRMYLTATTPGNHLRNIRVFREADEVPNGKPLKLFSADFLNRIRFYGIIRFMQWQHINEQADGVWATRPLPTDARWCGANGVPLEVMIDLCNETGAEMWLCVPHLADDIWIRESARLIDQRLAPGRRVWIEHSNEVWNGLFPQAAYAQQHGLAEGLSTNSWQAGWFWHSRRSVAIFRQYAEVLGTQRQLVRVMGGFANNAWGNDQALKFQDAAQETDALAIAPYFGGYLGMGAQAPVTATWTLPHLLQVLQDEALPRARQSMQNCAEVARRYEVDLVAYEGGHHLTAPQLPIEHPIHKLFQDAARSPEMGEFYRRHLRDWQRESGGDSFVHYSFCGPWNQWGSFNILEWITQPPTPREEALLEWAQQAR